VRIAQVSPLFESVPPRMYGGTERVVSYLTEELVAAGHDVTLFASGDSVTRATLAPMCERSLRLDTACIDQIAHHIRLVEEVYRRADDFDVVHFHIDFLHFPVSARQPIPHLTTLHGRLDIPDLVPLYRTFSEEPLVSISDAQRLPLDWANWLGTVHHGLPADTLDFHPGAGEYLAFLGRMSPEKRPDQAIEIARRTGIPLKMAAKIDKSDREYFEAKVRPLMDPGIVEFIGEINEKDKNDFLGRALGLVFLIDWPEPFGLVMIESMACGTPVITTRRGSVPEIIEDGRSGFIVGDLDQAEAVARQLAGFDRRRCREAFDARFTADRMARDYLRIYSGFSDAPFWEAQSAVALAAAS
jgi:glycosyltransferase involved in cell wall biosynthesis